MVTAGIPLVINGLLELADTEYEVSLPVNYKKLLIQARQNVALKIAYAPGKSGTTYLTLKAGSVYFEDGLRTNAKLYVQSGVAGTVCEVLVWYGGDDGTY